LGTSTCGSTPTSPYGRAVSATSIGASTSSRRWLRSGGFEGRRLFQPVPNIVVIRSTVAIHGIVAIAIHGIVAIDSAPNHPFVRFVLKRNSDDIGFEVPFDFIAIFEHS
jgi:hypothetical protein